MDIWNSLKNLIKSGKQSKTADDSGSTLVAAVDFLGQTRNVRQISSYGVYSNPPVGSNWIILSSRANSDDLHGIGNDYKNRPKNLLEGEVVLQNLLTGAFIKEHANGDIEVFTSKNITATAGLSITANAGVNITSTAGVNITATAGLAATVNAPTILVNSADTILTSTVAVAVIAPTITATATVAATIVAPIATVTAPIINLIGAVNITGTLIVNGLIVEDHRHEPSITPPTNQP